MEIGDYQEKQLHNNTSSNKFRYTISLVINKFLSLIKNN